MASMPEVNHSVSPVMASMPEVNHSVSPVMASMPEVNHSVSSNAQEVGLKQASGMFITSILSLSGETHYLGRPTIWGDPLSGETHYLGRPTIWGDPLSGETHYLGRLAWQCSLPIWRCPSCFQSCDLPCAG